MDECHYHELCEHGSAAPNGTLGIPARVRTMTPARSARVAEGPGQPTIAMTSRAIAVMNLDLHRVGAE